MSDPEIANRPGAPRRTFSRRTLIVTNDFPPRAGGIQTFVWELAIRQPPGSVIVYASDHPDAAAFDAAAPFPVIRYGGIGPRRLGAGLLLPTRRVRREAQVLAREHGCTAVWFGAAAPLALLAPALRRVGVQRVVATTHGHEVGWAILPGARQMLSRIGAGADVVTVLGSYTRRRLARALGEGRPRGPAIARMAPGVEPDRFAGAAAHRSQVRDRLAIPQDAPVLICVSRLVPRKGQDALIKAMTSVRETIPDAVLLIVGRGRYESALRRLAQRADLESAVVFAGAAPEGELVDFYGAGDVFAMPCRTRRGGMDVEGLGIVFLEASAAGLPVIVGDSGGAPDAVQDGVTGRLVDGRDVGAIAAAIVALLGDPRTASAMGDAGREWVSREWTWDRSADQLRSLLDG
jgi:phosphatidylinositol alpha-1,6-mannosyltransferase